MTAQGVVMDQIAENQSNTIASKIGRRSFLRGTGLTGLGLAGAAFGGAKLGLFDSVPGVKKLEGNGATVEAAPNMDVAIGNFALNLEYLEAEFYTMAVTGKTLEESGISVSGAGTAGPTTGGKMVNFSGEISGRLGAIAAEIMRDEQQHVALLRRLLGGYAIAKPTIDLNALGIGFDTFQQFLELSRAFEDTGVSAYAGAAPLITSQTNFGFVMRIGQVEALHSSNLRLIIAANNVQTTALDALDVLPPPSETHYFETVGPALSVVRTTSQVYGNSKTGTSKGGFFPDGVNGAITTV